jgi:transcriptional regulator with XRE-family HTH domain
MSETCQPQIVNKPIYISRVNEWFFGRYLQRLLDRLNLSAHQLHKLTGIPASNLYYLINGDAADKASRPNPTLSTIIKLAKALRVPPENLLQAFQGKDPDAATTSTPHPESTEALATRVIQDLDTMSKHVKQLLQAQGIATQGPTEPPPKA